MHILYVVHVQMKVKFMYFTAEKYKSSVVSYYDNIKIFLKVIA